MAIRNDTTREIIEAYFKGGNAKDKSAGEIRLVLETIQKIVEEGEGKENPAPTQFRPKIQRNIAR